jgi:hypothetical protein
MCDKIYWVDGEWPTSTEASFGCSMRMRETQESMTMWSAQLKITTWF